jgi:hypothetical protein
MTISLPQLIDAYANALADYRASVASGVDAEEIKYLKRLMNLAGWRLRDLGLDVQFDETGI